MKAKGLVFLLILFGLIGCGPKETLTFTDFSGAPINLNSSANKAIMILAPDCPLCQTYSTEFSHLADSFATLSMQFYGALPGSDYTDKEITHYQDSFQFDLPILLDPNFVLTKKLSAIVTPQFFIVDSNFTVLYKGKLDNWATGLAQKRQKPTKFYLKDALSALAIGEAIRVKETPAIGCVIEER